MLSMVSPFEYLILLGGLSAAIAVGIFSAVWFLIRK